MFSTKVVRKAGLLVVATAVSVVFFSLFGDAKVGIIG